MASLTNRLMAWANLGYRMAAHVLVRMPSRALGALHDRERFLDAVRPEGFLPLLPHERSDFPATMNCVHCGLCALAAPDASSAWQEAWTFVAGPSRALDRAPIVHASTPASARDPAAAAVCPMRVPIPRMAAVTDRMADGYS
jgi:hypothetical protein